MKQGAMNAMNELKIIEQNGFLLVDSRDVAEMTGKQHKDLLENIRGYVQHLISGNFRPTDFFIESMYKDSLNRTKPCYFLTRKGCDMVANKMTGEKGVIFTATYVTRFEEMEKTLRKPRLLSEKEQLMASMRLSLETSEELGEVKSQVKHLEEKVNEQITLNHGEQTSLQHVIKQRVEKLWGDGIKGTLETKKQMYSRIHSQLKRAFQAPSYRVIRRRDYKEAVAWISVWRPL